MEKASEKKEKKESKDKKESKFNSTRIVRQLEKSLKAVFPKAKFFVSDARPVEAITLDQNGYTDVEIETFQRVFCILSKVETTDLIITRAKRETQETASAGKQ